MSYTELYSMTTGTTCAGLSSAVRGFGNAVSGSYVGQTITKIAISLAGSQGTIKAGVWRNNVLVTQFGSDYDASNTSPDYTYVEFVNNSGHTLQSGDIIGFTLDGSVNPTCITKRTNGTDADGDIGAYYSLSGTWHNDGAAREYNQKVYTSSSGGGSGGGSGSGSGQTYYSSGSSLHNENRPLNVFRKQKDWF